MAAQSALSAALALVCCAVCCAAAKTAEDADPANRTWLEKAVTGPGSTIALAFICNKALMPVRLPITIALTPAVAR